MDEHGLLEEISRKGQDDVAPLGADIVHQLQKRPIVLDVPEQVGKKDQKRGKSANPDPRMEKRTALRGEQQAHNDAKPEQSDGVLLLHADAGDNAEPEPVAWGFFSTGAFYREDGEIGAAHPQIRFEAIGAEQATVGEILRRDDNGDCAEEQGKTASAELAREYRGLHTRRDEASAGMKRMLRRESPRIARLM